MTSIYQLGVLSSNEKRKMSYSLYDELLTEEWFIDMRAKTKVLWDIESLHIPWWAAHENYNELCQFIHSCKQDLNISKELHLVSENFQDAVKKINQLITNCIVSFTTCITISEVYVKNNYKNDSITFNLWNEKKKLLHAKSFAYRLSYELRNYSQHYSIPVSGVDIIMNGDAVKSINAYIDIRLLIKTGYNLKKLSDELKIKNTNCINIIEILSEYLNCINDIYKNTLELHADKLKLCANYLYAMTSKYSISDNEYPVVFKGEIPPNKELPDEKEFIPLYLFNTLTLDWLNILNYKII